MSNLVRKFVRGYVFWPLVVRHKRSYLLGLVSLFVVDALNVAMPLTVKVAVDALAPKNFSLILTAGIVYLFLMLVQAYGRYLWRIYLIGSSHAIAKQLRLHLYSHLQKLPLSYYQKVRTGDLMSRASNDIESVRMGVGPGILVSVDALFIFALMIPAMLWMSWKLTLFALAFYPLVPWITKHLGTKIDELFESLQKKMSALSAFTQESFGAIRLIKSLVLEPTLNSRFKKLSDDYLFEAQRLAKYQAVFSPSLSLLTNLGTFLILLWGGFSVLEGTLTIGTFVAFQRFVVQLSWPMEAIGWAVTMHREGAAALRRVNDVVHSPEVASQRSYEFQIRPDAAVITIDDLVFSYPDAPFHLQISDRLVRSGQKIGVVGGVGSGKSTLFSLLVRLYEPALKTIFFEGRDIASIPLKSLREQISSVEQNIFLFSEKVIDNLFLGSGIPVDVKLAEKVCRQAAIWEELLTLPQGLDTPLGERGVNLSGGQKQRLALARALLRDPKVLLLDDCFSAVDVDVEDRIINAIFRDYPKLTIIMASHRLSIMTRMDSIWLLDRGRIVDEGSHYQLIKKSALYQTLWEQYRTEQEKEKIQGWVESGGTL